MTNNTVTKALTGYTLTLKTNRSMYRIVKLGFQSEGLKLRVWYAMAELDLSPNF
jgi:hypothetical protein